MKIRIFRHYLPAHLLLLGGMELCVLVLSIYSGIYFRYGVAAQLEIGIGTYFFEILVYALVLQLMMIAVGLYTGDQYRDIRLVLVRLPVGFAAGFAVLTVVFYMFPTLAIWRSAFVIGMAVGFVSILAIRTLFLRFTGLSAFRHRTLVLGTGKWAEKIARLEDSARDRVFQCIGFVSMEGGEPLVDTARIITGVNSLSDFARDNHVDEIVVALAERRGGLPVEALLACKLAGIRVIDYNSFWERETGRVDLDAVNPSWLIFSDGFAARGPERFVKRLFDVLASALLLLFSLPILLLAAIAIKLDSPGPVLYRQERVGLNGDPFMLLKFRSMTVNAEADGVPRWAAEKDCRVTSVGRLIRITRIDEIPQIFNVLRGDMSFIVPRPERPFFVEDLSARIPYYSARHGVKPGISGWAQLNYPYGASIEDAREKLQYDLYYIKNYSLFLDLNVLLQTARVVLWPQGAR